MWNSNLSQSAALCGALLTPRQGLSSDWSGNCEPVAFHHEAAQGSCEMLLMVEFLG